MQQLHHLKSTQSELLEEVERLMQENENLKSKSFIGCLVLGILIYDLGFNMVFFSVKRWKRCVPSKSIICPSKPCLMYNSPLHTFKLYSLALPCNPAIFQIPLCCFYILSFLISCTLVTVTCLISRQ